MDSTRRNVALLGFTEAEAASFDHALREATTLSDENPVVAECHSRHFSFTVQGINALKETLHDFQYLLLVPKLPTWSRLPTLNTRGPRPMRSKRFPWGMPWVHGDTSSRLNDENVLIQMTFNCMSSFLRLAGKVDATRCLIFISPEDLGPAGDDAPPSLWQLKELQQLADRFHLRRAAFCQCRHGPSKHARPTGILASHPLPPGVSKKGWPKIADTYLGPLPRTCGCGRRHATMQRIKRKFNSPEGMLGGGTIKMLAAFVISSSSPTLSTTEQGLPRTRELIEALLPHAKLYEVDDDDYDTDTTVLMEPPECYVEAKQETEPQGGAESQQPVA